MIRILAVLFGVPAVLIVIGIAAALLGGCVQVSGDHNSVTIMVNGNSATVPLSPGTP